jgi:prepilin-type N-terminal cleavage/methylation domain-containing protein
MFMSNLRKKKTCHSQNQRGMTLVEIMVATFLGALVMGTVLSSLAVGINMLKSSEDATDATSIGQRIVEELIHDDFDSLESGNQDAASARRICNYQGDTTRFKSNIYVSTSPAPLSAKLKQINVRVYWKGKGGENNILISTLRTRAN